VETQSKSIRMAKINDPLKLLGSFLGKELSQTPKVFWLWELVLKGQDFARFIDIGTWRGNLSFYFHLFCLERNAEFYTFDTRRKWGLDLSELKEKLEFGKHFKQMDIFQHIEEIGNLIKKEGKTIIFCDDGNKPREFNTFSPYLKVADIIAVHDWNTEVPPESVKESCLKHNLSEIYSKECDEEGMIRIFQKA